MQLESSSDPCASQALKKHLPAYSVVDPYFKVGRSGANKWKIGLQITVYANHALKYYLREQWAGGKSCRIRGVIPSGYGRARMEMRCENGLSGCVGRRHRPVDNHLYFRMFSGCDLRLGVWRGSAKLSNQEIEYRLFFQPCLDGQPSCCDASWRGKKVIHIASAMKKSYFCAIIWNCRLQEKSTGFRMI